MCFALIVKIFEEQLVLSLDDDSYGEECPSSISGSTKSHYLLEIMD